MLKLQEYKTDDVNLQYNHPALLLGPRVEDSSIEEIAPFYLL